MNGARLESLDTLLGRSAAELREALVPVLRDLGWHEHLGKQRDGEQTLLEHSLAVFDVLCACAPFFAADARPALKPTELQGMLLATVAHDAGKTSPDFQAYLRGERQDFAEHVDADEIRRAVMTVASSLHIEIPHIDDIVSEAVLHDRRMRGDRGELAEWSRSHESTRWRKLADFVNHADSVASAPDVVASWTFLRRNPTLLGSARPSCYRVNVRGVSTTFLHKAARGAFEAAGHVPLASFVDGTVYSGFGLPAATDEIRALVKRDIDALFMQRREVLPELMVGAPLADFLPRPEYVRRNSIVALLRVARTRVSTKIAGTRAAEKEIPKWRAQWAKHPELGGEPTAVELQALLDVGPEACLFRMAKELFTKVLNLDSDDVGARSLYDERFGPGSFKRLMGQSTFMPVNDYARCVRAWHQRQLPNAPEKSIGMLDPSRRASLLLEQLSSVLTSAMETRTSPLNSEQLLDVWTDHLMGDLAVEAVAPGRDVVERQLAGYVDLKTRGRTKTKPPQQCAQCAALIEPGDAREASDALGNKGSYSNRRLAFEPEGRPPICPACVADLELGQVSLGRAVETAIAIVPRRSLGSQGAVELLRDVLRLRATLDAQLSPETADPTRYMALAFPQDALRADSLAEAAIRPVSESTRNDRRKKLAKALLERLGDDGLDALNADHDVPFEDVESLAEAILAGRVPDGLRSDADVAAAVDGVVGGGRVDFAAVTPNLVVVSLDRQLGGKDATQADRALYSFGLGALFALDLGMACLVAPVAELRTALATRGGRTVYVPANGPARRLLGGDWLGLLDAKRWLAAVRAAIVLGKRANAGSLLEVLRYPSAGYAIRRIEQQTDGGSIGPSLWPFVEALKEVLR